SARLVERSSGAPAVDRSGLGGARRRAGRWAVDDAAHAAKWRRPRRALAAHDEILPSLRTHHPAPITQHPFCARLLLARAAWRYGYADRPTRSPIGGRPCGAPRGVLPR